MAEVLQRPSDPELGRSIGDGPSNGSFDLGESLNDSEEDIPMRPSNPDPGRSLDGRSLNDTFDLKDREHTNQVSDDDVTPRSQDGHFEVDPGLAAKEQFNMETELERMRDELEDMDDYLGDKDGYPQIDMKERLRQLNEEWGAEEIIERKNTKVNFRENLVTLAIPPPEYSDEEQLVEPEDGDTQQSGAGGTQRSGAGDTQQIGAGDTQQSGTGGTQQSGAGDEGDQKVQEEGEGVVTTGEQVGVGGQGGGEGELVALYEKQMTLNEDSGYENELKTSFEGDEKNGVVEDERYRSSSNLDKLGADGNSFEKPKPDEESVVETLRRVPNESKVLIERNGKFELIDVSELSIEERSMMGLLEMPSEGEDKQPEQTINSFPNGAKFTPHPPRPRERPQTAQPIGLQRERTPQRRIHSAKTSNVSYEESWSYEKPIGTSKYGLTPEQKEFKKQQMMLKAQRMREKREQEEEERRRQQEEAESCFQAWLKKKKEDLNQKKKEERELRREEFEKRQMRNPNEAHETFEAWLYNKKQQVKLEQKIHRQQSQEEKDAYYYRSRQDCDKAFKEWVRSKKKRLRDEQSLKRAKALYTTQTAQKSKKARNISKALNLAQVYRYTDYYGYRF